MSTSIGNSQVLSQIIRAQDAWNQVMEKWKDVDTDTALLEANTKIKEAIEKGQLVTYVDQLEFLVGEKTAMQLQSLGYSAVTTQGNPIKQPDGSYKSTIAVSINFKYMPANTRDEYTT
jgi:hypothetical protein